MNYWQAEFYVPWTTITGPDGAPALAADTQSLSDLGVASENVADTLDPVPDPNVLTVRCKALTEAELDQVAAAGYVEVPGTREEITDAQS